VAATNTDTYGTVALQGTSETTVTFTTAEQDTNYGVLMALDTTSTVTNAVALKRKNTTSFVIANSANYGSSVNVRWLKIRTVR